MVMVSAAQTLTVPLLNVRFSGDAIAATPALKIRRISEEERSFWAADDEVKRLSDADELASFTHVIEQTDPEPLPMLTESSSASEQLYCLYGVLELLMDDGYDRVRAPFMQISVPALGWAPKILEMHGALTRRQQRISTPMLITNSSVEKGWNVVSAESDWARRLRRALGRATRAVEDVFAEDVILDSSIGLECMFSPDDNENVNNVVSGSTVEWLTGPESGSEPSYLITAFEWRKSQYVVRSDIVHGSELCAEDLSHHAKQFLLTLRQCLRIALFEPETRSRHEDLFDSFRSRLPAEYARHIAPRKKRAKCPNT